MKKTALILIACTASSIAFAQETPKADKENTFEIHAKGFGNSTWLFNSNISDQGESQNYAPGWGFNYGLGFSAYFGNVGFAVEGLMGNHVGAYSGKYENKVGGVVLSTTDYTSKINLKLIQVPVMFKLKSKDGAYLELGAQYNGISSATYKRTGDNFNADTTVTSLYANNFYSGVLGFGFAIKLGEESPLSILVGMRLQYSFTDLKGVDALGTDLKNPFFYKEYKPTSAATGGLGIGLVYRLGKKKS